MKILYVSTMASTLHFFYDFIQKLMEKGITVDLAANGIDDELDPRFTVLGCRFYSITTSRSPLGRKNLCAIRQLYKIVKKEHYDIVHCHTPIASAIVRLVCAPFRKNGTKVVYTAHGFHFYDGADYKSWLMFFPIEWFFSWVTDALVTINQDDFRMAKRLLHTGKTVYVPGVGLDIRQFDVVKTDRKQKRRELGVAPEELLLLSVGEMNENKNHQVVLKALGKIFQDKKEFSDRICFCIAGREQLRKELSDLAESIGVRLLILGPRKDVLQLMQASDVFLLPSKREGLSVSLMEAMAMGLPCLASDIRGNRDLIDEKNGFLIKPMDVSGWETAIRFSIKNKANSEKLADYNRKKLRGFSQAKVNRKVWRIYRELIREKRY